MKGEFYFLWACVRNHKQNHMFSLLHCQSLTAFNCINPNLNWTLYKSSFIRYPNLSIRHCHTRVNLFHSQFHSLNQQNTHTGLLHSFFYPKLSLSVWPPLQLTTTCALINSPGEWYDSVGYMDPQPHMSHNHRHSVASRLSIETEIQARAFVLSCGVLKNKRVNFLLVPTNRAITISIPKNTT